MRGLAADLRHALRLYLSTPVSTALAVLSLAFAMACVTAILSLFSDLTLKSSPGFADSRQLVTLGRSDGTRISPLSLRFIEQAGDSIVTLQAMAGTHTSALLADYDGERAKVKAELVTHRYFPDMQPRMYLGRGFSTQDHQADAEPVAVLSYRFWQQVLQGRADVLGSMLHLSGTAEFSPFVPGKPPEPPAEHAVNYRIVGVASSQLPGTFGQATDLWLPYEQAGPLFVGAGGMHQQIPALQVLARLAPQAQAVSVSAELNSRYSAPDMPLGLMPDTHFDALPGLVRDISLQRDAQRQVRLFLAGSMLLALVAACNISLYLLARAAGRQRELGIRRAVGAPVRRLARQLATEAALLVFVATLMGVFISVWLAVFLQHLALLKDAQWHAVTPFDWRVLGMVGGLTLLLTVFVSLAPIAGLRRLDIINASRRITARAGWAQQIAGTAQIGMAGVLAAAALAFGWHLWSLARLDPGFHAGNVLVVSLEPPESASGFSVATDSVLIRREQQRKVIGALPGVQAVAFGSSVPGQIFPFVTRVPRPGSDQMADFIMISADTDYPSMLGLELLRGHWFKSDEAGSIVINEAMAQSLWGRTDVVGEVVGRSALKVVGVLRNAAYGHPSEEIKPMAYQLAAPVSRNDMLLIQGRLSPAGLRDMLQRKIQQGALDIEIHEVQRLDDIWGAVLGSDRARSLLTAVSAVVVVLLAAFGFYGTQRYLVMAGRREYAIRAALGAGPRALQRLVLSRGLLLGLPGLMLGGVLAYIAVAWLRDDFVTARVAPGPVAALIVLGIVVLVLAASFGPARHARNTAPAPLLREE